MVLKAALRPDCILTWMVFIPSILGFHLTSNSPCERHRAHLANGVMTPRQSPIFSSQRLARGIQLDAIWGSSSSAPSSSSGEDDDTNDKDATKETEKTPSDEAVVDTTSMSSTDKSSDPAVESSTPGTEKSLLDLVNEIGNNFQVLAKRSTTTGYESKGQSKKILYAAKACIYYTLFIIYRAYRGIFVLLPLTFRQVYRKMEAAMNTGNLSLEEIGFNESGGGDMINNSSKWRTKVTVSILTTVVTISYVVGGILKMATKFLRTIVKTSDVPKSFGAAADEVMDFEGRISRVGKVNGDEGVEKGGLAP
jgi:hypothetical protein